jgi:hypothetical protein
VNEKFHISKKKKKIIIVVKIVWLYSNYKYQSNDPIKFVDRIML